MPCIYSHREFQVLPPRVHLSAQSLSASCVLRRLGGSKAAHAACHATQPEGNLACALRFYTPMAAAQPPASGTVRSGRRCSWFDLQVSAASEVASSSEAISPSSRAVRDFDIAAAQQRRFKESYRRASDARASEKRVTAQVKAEIVRVGPKSDASQSPAAPREGTLFASGRANGARTLRPPRGASCLAGADEEAWFLRFLLPDQLVGCINRHLCQR